MILKLLPEILLNGRKGLIKQASILIGGVEGGGAGWEGEERGCKWVGRFSE